MPKLSLIALATLVIGGLASGQVTIYVDAAATPGGNGTVGSPFALIQDGINAAIDGDTVQVAAGTYFEGIDFLGKTISLRGAGAASTTVDGSGVQDAVVKMVSGEGPGTSIEDLTVANGNAGWLSPAAAMIPGALPTGGGLVIAGSSPAPPTGSVAVFRCRFVGNVTLGGGGGVSVIGNRNANFADCVFESNFASIGGGISVAGGTTTITRCEIFGNGAQTGGGAHLSSLSTIHVIDSVFAANMGLPTVGGGQSSAAGVFCTSLLASFVRTTISGNAAMGSGSSYGGIYLSVPFAPAGTGASFIRDSVIADNTSPNLPALIVGVSTIANTTVTGNIATSGQGVAIAVTNTSPTTTVIENCIVYGNSVPELSMASAGGAVVAQNSNIDGAPSSSGNVYLDPLFVDSPARNYRLRHDSPLIDAGANSGASASLTDLDGRPRILNQLVDMGAYESDDIANHASAVGTLVDPAGGTAFRALTANGDDGGPDYRVTFPAFSPWTLSFTSPPWLTPHPDFAIFGALAEATIETVVSVPLGIGDMSFLPCPLAPQFEGPVFTLTSTVPLPCNEALPSVPGPSWTTPVIPGRPGPLDISFQGVLLDAMGGVHTTNLLIVNIR